MKIDTSQSIELNDGTLLTISSTGSIFGNAYLPLTHPAQPNEGLLVSFRLDGGLVLSNHKYHVRNKIVTMIDTTKPLDTISTYGDRNEAVFVTLTSEGHILVSTPKLSPDWIIFTPEGKFVRSSNGHGIGLTLANKAVVTYGYHATGRAGYVYTQTNTLERAREVDDTGPVIKTTITDGIITAVELIK